MFTIDQSLTKPLKSWELQNSTPARPPSGISKNANSQRLLKVEKEQDTRAVKGSGWTCRVGGWEGVNMRGWAAPPGHGVLQGGLVGRPGTS